MFNINYKYVSLEINSDNIKIMLSKRNKVVKYAIKSYERGLIKDGEILDVKALGLVIDNVFNSLDIPRQHVICTVTGLSFLYRSITLPSTVSDKDTIREALTRAARKEMQLDEDEFAISWDEMERRVTDVDYLVIAVRKQSVNSIIDTLKVAGIDPEIIDIKPLCLARLAGNQHALLACIERDYFDIVIVYDGIVRIIHSFPPNEIARNSENLVSDFTDGLNRALRSYNSEYPDQPLPSDITLFMNGELTNEDEIMRSIGDKVPYNIITEPRKLSNPVEIPMSIYSNNIGALIGKRPKIVSVPESYIEWHISVNLIDALAPPSQKRLWLAYATAGAACLVMIAAMYLVYDFQSKKGVSAENLEIKAVSLTRELGDKKRLYDGMVEKENNISMLQKKINTVNSECQQIMDKQNDFAEQLGLIESALPDGVVFTSLDLNSKRILITGLAPLAYDVLDYSENLEYISLFSEAKIEQIGPSDSSVSFSMTIPIENID